jgi:hypothetical protein
MIPDPRPAGPETAGPMEVPASGALQQSGGDRPKGDLTAVGFCGVSPLGHLIAPVFLEVRDPGRFRVGASEPS